MKSLITLASLLVTFAVQSQTYLHGEMGWPSLMGFEIEHFTQEDLSVHVNVGLVHVGLGVRKTLPSIAVPNSLLLSEVIANWYLDASTGLAGLVDVGGGSVTSLALGKRLDAGLFMVSAQFGLGWHDWMLASIRGSGQPSTREQRGSGQPSTREQRGSGQPSTREQFPWFTGQLKLGLRL